MDFRTDVLSNEKPGKGCILTQLPNQKENQNSILAFGQFELLYSTVIFSSACKGIGRRACPFLPLFPALGHSMGRKDILRQTERRVEEEKLHRG